jgi:hypothetical protein
MRVLRSWFTSPRAAREMVVGVLRQQQTIEVRVLAARANLPIPRMNAVLSRLERRA